MVGVLVAAGILLSLVAIGAMMMTARKIRDRRKGLVVLVIALALTAGCLAGIRAMPDEPRYDSYRYTIAGEARSKEGFQKAMPKKQLRQLATHSAITGCLLSTHCGHYARRAHSPALIT